MRLHSPLHETDFSVAELSAQRLDGILFAVGDGFVPCDLPEDHDARAASLVPTLGSERVAARSSAAWIWGALPRLERPLQACVGAGRSQAIEPVRGVSLREATLAPGDVVERSGLLVTSLRRTALDLVRDRDFDATRAEAVSALMRRAGDSSAELIGMLTETRFRRECVRARARLEALAA